VGCSLSKACLASGGRAAAVGATPGVCDPLQQLATICAREAGGKQQPGCARFAAACGGGAPAKGCKEAAGLALPVTAAEAVKQVKSICEEMDMEGCERCMPGLKAGKAFGGAGCDPFAVYGWLCVQMPGGRREGAGGH
jgi:hypothetical protein